MSSDSTHLSWSPTPVVNGRDLTLLTRTPRGIQRLDGQWLVAVNIILPQYSPNLFTRHPTVCFLKVDITCEDVFGILSRFLKFFSGERNVVCSAMTRMKSTLGIIQLWFNYFVASFFKTLGNIDVNYLKIPEKHHGPHVARVFETSDLLFADMCV